MSHKQLLPLDLLCSRYLLYPFTSQRMQRMTAWHPVARYTAFGDGTSAAIEDKIHGMRLALTIELQDRYLIPRKARVSVCSRFRLWRVG